MTGQSQSQTKCLWPKAVEYYTRFCWWRVILKSNVFEKWTILQVVFLSIFFSPKDLLKRCYSANASYLFQQDKFYDVSYDTGDKSIQCSRRPDAFKFWMAWKALGTLGLEERVNRALALSRYLLCGCVCVSMGV